MVQKDQVRLKREQMLQVGKHPIALATVSKVDALCQGRLPDQLSNGASTPRRRRRVDD
jgi:hypothetical protein